MKSGGPQPMLPLLPEADATGAPAPAARGRRRGGPEVAKVAVPCCACGGPTAMRVPSALLDELQIWHLCAACARV